MAKNKLVDLNNHLFAALERLNEEDLSDEEITKEVKRANAVAQLGDKILGVAELSLKAEIAKSDKLNMSTQLPPMFREPEIIEYKG